MRPESRWHQQRHNFTTGQCHSGIRHWARQYLAGFLVPETSEAIRGSLRLVGNVWQIEQRITRIHAGQ